LVYYGAVKPSGERELSGRAIVFGLLLGAVLAAGNVYAGNKLSIIDTGMTVMVLLSFALFTALRRPLGPLETNITQTVGSSAATMSLTAGVLGPIPALAMGGDAPPPVVVALLGIALGVLGTLLAAPFRRQLIEEDALAFPSGQVTAELIKDLAAAERSSARGRVIALIAAFAVAVLIMILRDPFGLVPSDLMLPILIAGVPAATLGIGLSLSTVIVGVGLLVGLRVALSWLGGSLLAWAVMAPMLYRSGLIPGPDFGSAIGWLLWPGAALMVASSFTSLVFGARDLVRGWTARRADHSADDARLIRAGVIVCGVAVVVAGWLGFGVNPLLCLLALAISIVFSIVAMRATGETDQAPAGPLGGLAQVAIGATAPGSTVSTLFAGTVTNGVAGHSSGMMIAWKAGHLLAASPRRMMVAQLLGVSVGSVAAVLAFALLDRAYGIGSPALPAPAAMSWKATADLVQGGISSMPPWAPLGALVAALVGILLGWLERGKLGRFVPSPVALGIGFVVPANFGATIAIAALVLAVARRRAGGRIDEQVPSIAAGLIIGEALTALVMAAIAVLRS
jgi:uncharacterized oligopeptide transporter (OPT) family protein